MLLVLDLGNTNLTIGLYDGERLAHQWRLQTETTRTMDEYGLQLLTLLQHVGRSPQALRGICLGSVVPALTEPLVQACLTYLGRSPLLVDASLKTGLRLGYEDPRQLGADRIADVVAAYHRYGGPACIIDFGTATTFNALTADGVYLGGAITVGVALAAETLFTRAARLPRIELEWPPSIIGRNTVHAMQSGLLFGYLSLVEGMVARFRQELGPAMKVIATGGLAEVIAPATTVIDTVVPWLTLEGLRLLWEMNHAEEGRGEGQ